MDAMAGLLLRTNGSAAADAENNFLRFESMSMDRSSISSSSSSVSMLLLSFADADDSANSAELLVLVHLLAMMVDFVGFQLCVATNAESAPSADSRATAGRMILRCDGDKLFIAKYLLLVL